MRSTVPWAVDQLGGKPMAKSHIGQDVYADDYVRDLFDRMGPTYALTNLISSFGFSSLWRRECVRNVGIQPGDDVCDLMSGTGECWGFALRSSHKLTSVDFSAHMISSQEARANRTKSKITILQENALKTSLPDECFDCVFSAFGLKTFDRETIGDLAQEVHRILKPGGRFSFLEISTASEWMFGSIFRWYVCSVIPRIGSLCLGDIECYRMLGTYTTNFKSCELYQDLFQGAGLNVSVQEHFFGCATSLVGSKTG